MKILRHKFFSIWGTLLIISQLVFAQLITIDEDKVVKQYPHVSLVFNRIFNSQGIDTFYQKLYGLKKNKKGIVTVVHIGDSHIAAVDLPEEVRNGFQNFFGNAGKGKIFPKKLSEFSNAINGDSTGVVYQAIGINGARYESFNRSSSFWQQLSKVKADLFIVSLGTNEAEANVFKETEFFKQVSLFIENLKKACPTAAVLITTAADSFKNGHLNRELWNLNLSLFLYGSSHNIPVWDLYRVTNGFGSAHYWRNCGMLQSDGIHYTSNGYKIQGRLLFNALAKGYNAYVGSY
jgi:lysophospholipase L1-like esterase